MTADTASRAPDVPGPEAPGYSRALLQRLTTAAPVLAPAAVLDGDDPRVLCGELLEQMVGNLRANPSPERLWLLVTVLTGEFPVHATVERVRRRLELADDDGDALYRLLDECFRAVSTRGVTHREMDLVTDRPVVLVDFAARHNLMTGVQRVVRHTVPYWMDGRPLALAAWTLDGAAFCHLTEVEQERVVQWHRRREAGVDDAPGAEWQRLVVPWRTDVLLLEVTQPYVSERLAALARHSGSRLTLVGYDCIPVVSAELVPAEEHAKFMHYLEVVKYADEVACISAAAAAEFRGFVRMVTAQGLPGPRVTVCALPTGSTLEVASLRHRALDGDVADEASPRAADAVAPSVVCVGSIDRRKNQIAVLEAAERLWRDGHEFTLRLIGSGGVAPADTTAWIAELIAAGRPLRVDTDVSDELIHEALTGARFSVFPSLHEGFGIPVVESLTLGVPVVTSDRGSLEEVTAGDGALLVDPTDADALTAAMRRLLTDDALHGELVERARALPRTTWSDYAAQLWGRLGAVTP